MSLVSESVEFDGHRLQLTWQPGPERPPRAATTQASGVCFVDGKVVLVRGGTAWGLPGGHPEVGETIEQAFAREFAEEATGRVTDWAYLGAVRVGEPGMETYYQTRFWARAELQPFQLNEETTERRLVPPEEVAGLLAWKNVAMMHATLNAAFAREAEAQTGTAPEAGQR